MGLNMVQFCIVFFLFYYLKTLSVSRLYKIDTVSISVVQKICDSSLQLTEFSLGSFHCVVKRKVRQIKIACGSRTWHIKYEDSYTGEYIGCPRRKGQYCGRSQYQSL
jgi:hypothetical protein